MALTLNSEVNTQAAARGTVVAEGEVRQLEERGIESWIIESASFEGKAGQVLAVPGDGFQHIVIGIGAPDQVTHESLCRTAAVFVRAASGFESASLEVNFDAFADKVNLERASQAIGEGLLLGSYKYTQFKTDPKSAKLDSVSVIGASDEGLHNASAIAGSVYLARDLVNGPASLITPTRLAEVALEIADRVGLGVKVLTETEIEAEGLGGLLGVSRGSDEPPRLIELTYEPEGGFEKSIALVGKGITFDSGGLSLKPAAGMMTMKTDMGGAAAVLATMSALEAFKPNVKITAIVCATENLPGPKATKPGDVLKARNGKTMEVLNTDAEGRLVLADGLSLAVEAGVDAIVDVATLTGACVVALGTEIAGLMSNNEEFGDVVKSAAESAGESVWQLPLPKQYRKHIDSEIADIKNIGAGAGAAGALSAGLFLQEFVGDVPWVHLDIAGPERAEADDAYIAKGGTGFGTRTLIQLVRSYR